MTRFWRPAKLCSLSSMWQAQPIAGILRGDERTFEQRGPTGGVSVVMPGARQRLPEVGAAWLLLVFDRQGLPGRLGRACCQQRRIGEHHRVIMPHGVWPDGVHFQKSMRAPGVRAEGWFSRGWHTTPAANVRRRVASWQVRHEGRKASWIGKKNRLSFDGRADAEVSEKKTKKNMFHVVLPRLTAGALPGQICTLT